MPHFELVADTNVWYDIASGVRNPSALRAEGNLLKATPTSLLEIVSLIDEDNFALRKAAAKAVVVHADGVIIDSDSHCARLCGLLASYQPIDWFQAYKAAASAISVDQLTSGVPNFVDRVIGRVNVALAHEWRNYHWLDFQNKVIDAIDSSIPGYRAARCVGELKVLGGREASDFADAIRSVQCQDELYKAVFYRALLVTNQQHIDPTAEEMVILTRKFGPYVGAYTEYLIRCGTGMAPQRNDFGDLECFMYLQGNRRFLSSDKRWVKIARTVCPAFEHDPERMAE